MTNTTERDQGSNTFDSLSALLLYAFGNVLTHTSGSLLDLMTEDVVFDFPFPMPNGIRRIEGKAALRDYLPKVGAALSIDTLFLERAFLSEDRKTAVVEFSCKGSSKTNGARYDQDYMSVLNLRDGLISQYRDYWNPLTALSALGDSELANATSAEQSALMRPVSRSEPKQ